MLTDNPAVPLILVVEDDGNHAILIKRSFECVPDEYRLMFASTLLAAQEAIDRHLPDLIVTDYRLPDGDGSDLMLRAKGKIPVVLMTAQGSEQIAVEAMKSGVQDYIVKSPESFGRLPDTAKYAINSWALIQSRKLADEAVSRGKREWEQTFDAVPDLIAIIDTNHTVLRVNRAMAYRCGLGPEALVGRKCHELVHCSASPAPFCPQVSLLQDGQIHNVEVEIKELGGFFDITVSPLYDADGCLIAAVHVARDITERKQAEEERKELERQFQQTQKLESLGVLAGGIAHDFNNILTIILGHCYIITNDINSGMTFKEHAQQIEEAGNRAAELCRQMLTYAGQSSQTQTRVNLWQQVDEVVKMLTSVINKNVTIELDLNRSVPELIGDNAQIQQVVMNLIINASEAIGDKNGTIKVSLRNTMIQAEQLETDFFGNAIPVREYACLEVSDNGCGIDKETQQRIFEPFFTTKFTGRGLGMSVVLGIVKAHDGALQLTSSPGVGTTCKVYFPLPEKADPIETAQTAWSVTSAKATGTVMLVDDEESLRIIGSSLLKSMGFSVITASNGREALEIYNRRRSEIDLILMDMIMPEMGGIEAYNMLREVSPSIPIVICSGYNVEEILEKIVSDDRSAVIQKPYKPDQVLGTLIKLLEKKG